MKPTKQPSDAEVRSKSKSVNWVWRRLMRKTNREINRKVKR
jgi:hypothetical protein